MEEKKNSDDMTSHKTSEEDLDASFFKMYRTGFQDASNVIANLDKRLRTLIESDPVRYGPIWDHALAPAKEEARILRDKFQAELDRLRTIFNEREEKKNERL